ncbi:hypothetical protein F5B22DRAFT_182554 [Xylaria bambusicola]|uniref:uncharacterized protein n=1 Tax=Xylaria bambusicola TaxID=326684 RepID=UPI0020074BE6|nr:uncharacterized protein F5B22DRAFT_182554 [Xylaria bambusicola]KAI0516831.1 hypothetical protein F5B22DRAFT_182554 [Xylaria bambusicola]
MLLRQLHRPLLRSAAAAWRPATISPAFYHDGDGNGDGDGRSSNDQQQEDSNDQQHSVPSQEKGPSLFEKLLPEEAKAKLASKGDPSWIKKRWPPNVDEEPPRLPWSWDIQDLLQNAAEDAPNFFSNATRAKSMLILSAASKNLLESDFLRLGMKGKHVEGWVGGIIRVIQARDPDTLEPKGHYFILFDSHEAASAYKDRVEYLWELGKAHVPGAHHARSHMQQQPLPRGLWRTETGEDVAHLIRTFTLVPHSQPLYLTQSRLNPAKITDMYLEGGFIDKLAARAGSPHLVHVRLDGGRLSVDTMRSAIEMDGKRRYLAWRVTDLEKGILPFGKAILKSKDRVRVEGDNNPDNRRSPSSSRGSMEEGLSNEIISEQEYAETNGTVEAAREVEESNQRHKQYPRFIIPFTDQPEAYRFVQNWHRRELNLRFGGTGKRNDPSWQETRIVNATILW